jgi:hypothetical protein
MGKIALAKKGEIRGIMSAGGQEISPSPIPLVYIGPFNAAKKHIMTHYDRTIGGRGQYVRDDTDHMRNAPLNCK